MSLALRVVCALLGVIIPVAGTAAEVWLRPDRFSVTPGATLGAEVVAVGDLSGSISLAVREARVALAGSLVPVGLEPWNDGQRAQRISATFTRPGWSVWSVDLAPTTESLSCPEVASRLHALYAPSGIHERVLARGMASRWRLSSQASVKCIVTVGEPDPEDRSWGASSGSGWDLTLGSDLSALRAGQPARFTVLAGTLRVAGAVVTLRSLNGDGERAAPADADGSAEFVMPDPGLWLASASHVQISSADDSLLEVRSVSFVFTVK